MLRSAWEGIKLKKDFKWSCFSCFDISLHSSYPFINFLYRGIWTFTIYSFAHIFVNSLIPGFLWLQQRRSKIQFFHFYFWSNSLFDKMVLSFDEILPIIPLQTSSFPGKLSQLELNCLVFVFLSILRIDQWVCFL